MSWSSLLTSLVLVGPVTLVDVDCVLVFSDSSLFCVLICALVLFGLRTLGSVVLPGPGTLDAVGSALDLARGNFQKCVFIFEVNRSKYKPCSKHLASTQILM